MSISFKRGRRFLVLERKTANVRCEGWVKSREMFTVELHGREMSDVDGEWWIGGDD